MSAFDSGKINVSDVAVRALEIRLRAIEKASRTVEREPGPKGDRGPPGLPGDVGPPPAHKWEGTKLSFEQPDGAWGKPVDLKGPPGESKTVVVGPVSLPAWGWFPVFWG
jgi:hypothetical protein